MNSQGSTAIQAFVFPKTKHKVRVVIDKHGNPGCVAKDACDVLGIDNPSQALSRLDDDEKADVILNDAIGRPQNTAVVNESGLYALIFNSRKPEAKAFQKWVTSEVLPTIRETGAYGHKPQPEFDLTNLDPDAMIETLLTVQQQRKQEKARQLGCGSTTSPTFPRTSHTAITPPVGTYTLPE